jgi:hypothetical protein
MNYHFLASPSLIESLGSRKLVMQALMVSLPENHQKNKRQLIPMSLLSPEMRTFQQSQVLFKMLSLGLTAL